MRHALPGGFELDDDPARIDVDEVRGFLANDSYWARGRPRETVERLVREASRVVGLYDGDRQIGFTRTVSDGVAFGYLADVYVLPEYRQRSRPRTRARDGRARAVRRLQVAPAHE